LRTLCLGSKNDLGHEDRNEPTKSKKLPYVKTHHTVIFHKKGRAAGFMAERSVLMFFSLQLGLADLFYTKTRFGQTLSIKKNKVKENRGSPWK